MRKNKGKLIAVFLIITFFIIAFATKPSDRTIKKEAIKIIWGNLMPPENKYPQYYEEFMNYTSTEVYIDDWFLLKRIQFKTNDGIRPIGYAAFGKVMIRK